MDEEHLKVLQMIKDGKITPEEGAQLLEALDDNATERKHSRASQAAPSEQAVPPQAPGRYFRVRITDVTTGKTRTNVRLPLKMVSTGMKLGMRFAPELDGMDLSKLQEFISAGDMGQIVDVYDDDDGERVEVFIE